MEKAYKFFKITQLFNLTLSISFMLMSVTNIFESRIFVIIVGVLFWLSLIGTYVCIFLTKKYDKTYRKRERINFKEYHNKNIELKYAKRAFVLSMLLFVALMFTSLNSSFVAYILLGLMTFSLNHCFLIRNGLNIRIKEGREKNEY